MISFSYFVLHLPLPLGNPVIVIFSDWVMILISHSDLGKINVEI